MTFDNSKHSPFHEQRDSDDALHQALSEDSLAALQERLTAGGQADEQARSHTRVDRLLRETSMAAPSPGFTERVMAAIAALPLPEYVRRELSVGVALGLLAAMVLTVPLLVVAFVGVASVVTSPSGWGRMLNGAIDAASSVGALLLDIGDELQTLVSGTPVVPALLAVVIPLVVVWGWVVWQFWGKGHASLKR